MDNIQVGSLLAQMRAMSVQAQGVQESAGAGGSSENFAGLLRDSLGKVNEIQGRAGELAHAFELGDKNIDLPQVMIAMQKANLTFQALTQVRNKFVSTYQEIMNMQI